jgi:hypothetical protein
MISQAFLDQAKRNVLGACLLACHEKPQASPQTTTDQAMEEHAVLAGSFVSGDTAGLDVLLHPDLVVQPPSPDSARRGPAAKAYLRGLAANTQVSESRLQPHSVNQEGSFAFEQGIWELRSGGRVLQSPYVLRWRSTPGGWRVVLWRWGGFQ